MYCRSISFAVSLSDVLFKMTSLKVVTKVTAKSDKYLATLDGGFRECCWYLRRGSELWPT